MGGEINLAFNFSRHGMLRFVSVVLGGWLFSFFSLGVFHVYCKSSEIRFLRCIQCFRGCGWKRGEYLGKFSISWMMSWLGVVVQQPVKIFILKRT